MLREVTCCLDVVPSFKGSEVWALGFYRAYTGHTRFPQLSA